MKIKYITILILIFFSTSCSIVKKNIVSEKDSQKKESEFIYLFDEANKNRLNGDLQTASEQYIAALEVNPESAASNFYIASIYISKEDYQTALHYAEKAVKLQNENFWYNLEKADLLNKIGKQKDALVIYNDLLKKYPEKEFLYNKLFKIYFKNKDVENLISVLEKKQKNYEYSPETAEKLFNLYLREKNFKQAEKTISKLIKQYPNELRYQGMAAEFYYSVNQTNKAEKIYDKLLSEYPENTDLNFSYALFCKKTHKQNEFFSVTKKLMSSDLEFLKKTSLLTSGQYRNFPDNEYFILLTDLYKKHPDEILANTFFAEYYIDKNNKKKAIPYIRKALELNPADFNMAIMLFSLTYDIKDYENLLKDTKKFKSYFPNQPKVFLYNGIAEYNLQNYPEAEQVLKIGKNLIIDDIELEDQFDFYLALIYKKQHKFEKALGIVEKIRENNDKNIKIFELCGDLLFATGKKNQALIYWKKAKENGNNTKNLNFKINNFSNLTINDILK